MAKSLIDWLLREESFLDTETFSFSGIYFKLYF